MLRLIPVWLVLTIMAMAGAARASDEPPSDWKDQSVTYFRLSPPEPAESTAAIADDASCPMCNCCECCCWSHCCRPLWSINAGAIFLTRSTPHRSPIVRDGGDTSTLLNANQFDFDWVSGPDVEITRRIDRTYALDAFSVRYFGVQSLAAYASVDTGGPWQFPNSTSTSASAEIDSVYRSQLYSTELNAQHNIDCTGITWLAGFRWVQLNDQLSNVANDGTLVDYRTTTQNNLYGAQFGLIVSTPPDAGRFSLRWTSKAGVYGNAARNYWTANSAFLSGDSQGQLAFVGDVNVIGAWRLNDHVSLQGGYQLLWVEQAAIASDQFAVMEQDTTQTGINAGGGAFFQGAVASVNVRW